MNAIDRLAAEIDRWAAKVTNDAVRVSQGIKRLAPRARQRIIRGRIYVIGESGVLSLRPAQGGWHFRLLRTHGDRYLTWPDEPALLDEQILVAGLASVLGCPVDALDSTAAGLRWLALQGADFKGGPSHA